MIFSDLISKLENVIKEIKEGAPTASSSFATYLDELLTLPPFTNSQKWDQNWRLRIYDLGRLFSDEGKVDPAPYFEILDKKDWENKEPLAFIHSEIVWNFWAINPPFIKDEFSHLIKKFPGNPEFYHSYGHYLSNKKEFEQAILNYRKAVQLDDFSGTFVTTLFNTYSQCFSDLISRGKIDKAEEVLNSVRLFFNQDRLRGEYWVFRNMIYAMGERLSDHKLINGKIEGLNEVINKRADGLRSQLVNVVALFTSIIGYILIGTNMVINAKSVKESFFMMYGLGIVLVIFVITVSYQFKPYRSEPFWDFLKHRQFWAIITLIAILLFSYWRL